MATNEECVEIAHKLRSIDERIRKFGQPPGTSSFEFEQVLGLCHIPVTDDSIYSRLADLIEPEPERTCHDFGGEEGTNGEQYEFACSACGFIGDVLQPNYCPNCGAKVVEDGD